MPNPYAGSGVGVRQLRTIRASKPWGKRHYNLTGAKCSAVLVTDKHGNTRTLEPLVHGAVVRLHKRTYKVVMAGERTIQPDLTQEQEDAILAQLASNREYKQGFNIHDK
jgi:hypothetical protein